MPFTFAHPAIVLPLKKWFSATGLIIGSVSPDFEYFLRMRVKSAYSHTLAGIFWFDLPLSLLLAFVFHNLARNSLIENMPPVLKKRFCIYKAVNWNQMFSRNWVLVLISIIIGAFSHILWDSFTHADGYFANHISWLKNVVLIFNANIPVYKILQHISTFAGVAVIVFYIAKMPVYENAGNHSIIRYWGFSACIVLITVFIKAVFSHTHSFGDFIVASISGLIIGMFLYPLLKWQYP